VESKAVDDERAVTIANNLITVVSTLLARGYVVTAACADNISNEVSMLNQLHIQSLPCLPCPPIVRIPCIAHTANLELGDFLTESTGATLCDTQEVLIAPSDCTNAPFSTVPRVREEHWFSLREVTKYIMTY
jgi:hypothetical protein